MQYFLAFGIERGRRVVSLACEREEAVAVEARPIAAKLTRRGRPIEGAAALRLWAGRSDVPVDAMREAALQRLAA